jgi:hypothetical protein
MRTRTSALFALGALLLAIAPAHGSSNDLERVPVPRELSGGFVITAENGVRHCRRATVAELEPLRGRERATELHVLDPAKLEKARRGETTGLTIILRGTPQLEQNQAAKAAFTRAAATWEALIRTPITVLIDVDFGTTAFGDPYDPGILGITDSQFGSLAYTWGGVRNRLLMHSNSQAETDLLNKLPPSTGVPTTEGTSTFVYIPTSVQRALGILDAVPDEAGEMEDFGPPPAIGLNSGQNSGFSYDFDPTNGVDSNKQDFNATALHEMGHALGFDSWEGVKEIDPTFPQVVTTWDLYRFRPGVTLDGFTTTQRCMSPGGEQINFAGAGSTRLSTGDPFGEHGDGYQGSHWKENTLNNGIYIGIMDAAGADGDKDQLMGIDLVTLDLIGYDVRGLVSLDDAVGSLVGNTLTITGDAVVANLVLSTARVELFDKAGNSLGEQSSIPINAVGASAVTLNFALLGFENFLSATAAEITLVDDKGNESAPLRVDFGQADSGGPTIANLSYNGKKLKLTGSGLVSTAQLEVNGVVVPATIKSKGGAKATIKGTPAALGLQSGANRVRFISGGLRSNIFVLNR